MTAFPHTVVTVIVTIAIFVSASAAGNAAEPPKLTPGQTLELEVNDADLPPTLYTLMNGTPAVPGVTVRLPEDYTSEKTFPLVVYVPGFDGNYRGNMGNATALAGTHGWIAATLPLFKQTIDRKEPAGGVIVSLEDYPAISRAYAVLLGRVFATVPNIDRAHSALVGFSNGAITIAVLLSNHDEFTLSHFRAFCLVDHGMFHLTDLHKRGARDAKYLLLVGDQPDMGRDLKIQQGRLQERSWRLLGVDLTCRVMENTGHVFNEPQIALVRNWLQSNVAPAVPP